MNHYYPHRLEASYPARWLRPDGDLLSPLLSWSEERRLGVEDACDALQRIASGLKTIQQLPAEVRRPLAGDAPLDPRTVANITEVLAEILHHSIPRQYIETENHKELQR